MFSQKGFTDKDNQRYIDKPEGRYRGNAQDYVTRQPKLGVSVMLVKEYLKRAIDKEVDKAIAEFTRMTESCRKGNEMEITQLKGVNKNLRDELTELKNDYRELIQVNKLTPPPPKKVDLKKKKKVVVPVDEYYEEEDLYATA